MLIYSLNIAFIVLMLIYSKIKKGITGIEISNTQSSVVFLLLSLISGFRTVGTDLTLYNPYFETINLYSFKETWLDFEIGYYYLNRIIASFTGNFQFVLLLTSIITIYLINKTLKDYSSSYILSIFLFITLYLYFKSFNNIRQYLAIAITFYSLRYIIERKFWKYFFVVVSASLFHISSLILLPFYWVSRFNFSKITYLFFIIISIVLSLLANNIILSISILFPKFSYYINYSQDGASVNSVILILSFIILFIVLFKDKIIKNNENALIYINMVVFALFFNILVYGNFIFNRIAEYFYIYTLLIVPDCIKVLNKYLKIVFYIYFIPLLISYFYYQLLNNNAGVYPYNYNLNIFNNNVEVIFVFLVVVLLVLIKIFKRYITKNMQKFPI